MVFGEKNVFPSMCSNFSKKTFTVKLLSILPNKCGYVIHQLKKRQRSLGVLPPLSFTTLDNQEIVNH